MSRYGFSRSQQDNLDNEPLSYGEYIPKLDVADTGDRPAVLEIASVYRRNMAPSDADRKDIKIVLRFGPVFDPPRGWDGNPDSGREREYVVNATSYKTLCSKFGSDEKRWVGRSVVMVPTTSNFGNERFRKMHVGMPNEWDAVIAAAERARAVPSARGKKAT